MPNEQILILNDFNQTRLAQIAMPGVLKFVVGKPIIFNDGITKYLAQTEETLKRDWKWLAKRLSHSTGAMIISLACLTSLGCLQTQTGSQLIKTPITESNGVITISSQHHSLLSSLEFVLPFFKPSPVVKPQIKPLGEALTRKMAVIKTQEKKEFFAKHLEDTYQLDPHTSKEIVSNAFTIGEQKHIQPTLLLAMAEVESHFNPKAVSHAGAVGLVQVMPSAHPLLVKQIKKNGDNLKQIKPNLMAGANILHEYIRREKGNVRGALQRYNGSLKDHSHRYATKVLRAKAKLDRMSAKNTSILVAEDRG